MISSDVLAVERAGRLVGEQDLRIVDERAGNGDALLLAARELARVVVEAVAEIDLLEAPAGHRLGVRGLRTGVEQRQHHLLQGRGARQQVELLEDEADACGSEIGELVASRARRRCGRRARACRSVGTSSAPIRFIMVDLPEPDGPMMATNSPARMSSETSSSARTVWSPIVVDLGDASAAISSRGAGEPPAQLEGLTIAGHFFTSLGAHDDAVAFLELACPAPRRTGRRQCRCAHCGSRACRLPP